MAPSSRHLTGILWVVALALVGLAVVWLPPQLFWAHDQIARFSPALANAYLGAVIVTGAAAIGYTLWLVLRLWYRSRRKSARRGRALKRPSQLTAAEKEQEILELLANGRAFGEEADLPDDVRMSIDKALGRIQEKLTGQSLEIVAFGTVSSGKSSLLNALAGRDVFRTDVRGGTTVARNEIPWPGDNRVVLVDTPGLAEVDGPERHDLSRRAAAAADLVLLVVDGPLKDFEYRLLAQLADMEKRVILCLNKEDWYAPEDRVALLDQLRQQVAPFRQWVDVIPVRTRAATLRRVRVAADGSEHEEAIVQEADIGALAIRMLDLVRRSGRELVLVNLLLQSRGMIADAREQVRAALDRRARELVDRYMWQAGGAAALSPLPVIDVAAALAISVKMVLELATVYQQQIDLDAAQRLVGELGKNLVSIVGMNVAGPAAGTAIASLLKTVPGVGTITGGVLQGLVQALVTRWIGFVFMDYFRAEMREPERGWAAVSRRKWEQLTTAAELTRLVKSGMKHLGGGDR